MERVRASASQAARVRAIEANFQSLPRHTSCCSRFTVHEDDELAWTLTDVKAFPMFNCVTRTHLGPETADRAIDAMVERARSRNVSMTWWQEPSSTPKDLGARLLARGFVSEGEAPGMSLDLGLLPSRFPGVEGLSIAEVDDLGALAEWSSLCSVIFEIPADARSVWSDLYRALFRSTELPTHHYVGTLDGQPVAVSTVVFAAGVAGIYNVGTLEAARRRGIGAAMTLAPLARAAQQGYELAVLQSSPLGLGVYRGLGFQRCCNFSLYCWAPKEKSPADF